MKCPNCGNDLIPGALFCASCGNKIPEELLHAAAPQNASKSVAETVEPSAPEQPAAPVGETPVESKPETVPVADENENTENVVTATAGEAGNTAQTAQTAASQIPMGALVVPEMETDKKKKTRTRLIGVAAVAVVVAAVGFGGFKVWNAMNPQLDKQMIYAKAGRLYFTPNVSKEKDPVEIYNAHDNSAEFEVKYTKNQKYAFFRTFTLGSKGYKSRLYRVNTQKLTSNESKNDKYIEEIDSGVTDFSVLGSDRILYYRASNSGRELNFYDGKDTKEIDSNVWVHYHSGNVVYYLRCEGYINDDNDNFELYYYNLKTGKHGDMGECDEVADYNENEILYSVSNGDTCDIYKAKPGSEGTKIVSDVESDWTGNLDAGVISYTKENIYNSDNDSSVYVNINGKEQDMKMTDASMYCSEDGKTVMIVDRSDRGSDDLIAYKKKGDSLEKIGTVEKDYEIGSWYGNDYYYLDDNRDFYIYSNGKSKKIAKDVYGAELEDDGTFMVYDRSSDLKVLKGDEQIGKFRDVYHYRDHDSRGRDRDYHIAATYVDKNCIVYLTNDDDLNVYDGEDSRKIDGGNLYRYWMCDDSDKARSIGWH